MARQVIFRDRFEDDIAGDDFLASVNNRMTNEEIKNYLKENRH